jgi:hypothetical protein
MVRSVHDWHVVLRWDEINNKLHDIILALIREVIL